LRRFSTVSSWRYHHANMSPLVTEACFVTYMYTHMRVSAVKMEGKARFIGFKFNLRNVAARMQLMTIQIKVLHQINIQKSKKSKHYSKKNFQRMLPLAIFLRFKLFYNSKYNVLHRNDFCSISRLAMQCYFSLLHSGRL
jgi:hypothetical protein